MTEFKACIPSFLKDSITADSVVYFMEIAQNIGLEPLEELCSTFLIYHLEEVLRKGIDLTSIADQTLSKIITKAALFTDCPTDLIKNKLSNLQSPTSVTLVNNLKTVFFLDTSTYNGLDSPYCTSHQTKHGLTFEIFGTFVCTHVLIEVVPTVKPPAKDNEVRHTFVRRFISFFLCMI
jgi:hypothetical protein